MPTHNCFQKTELHQSPPTSPIFATHLVHTNPIEDIPISPTDKVKRSRDYVDESKEACLRFQKLTCDSLPHSPPQTPLGSVSRSQGDHSDDFLNENSEPKPKRRSSVELNLKNFTLIKTLGTGSFGRVHLAQSKMNKRYYAIKVLRKTKIVQLKQVEHTKNERLILSKVKQGSIVNLWGTFQDDANLYVVMDYVPGGELFTYMRRLVRLPEDTAKFYAAQVLGVISYLHKQDIIYRDLKPENILLDEQGYIKITDFGFAKIVPDITWTLCGTPDYLAPEIIQSKGYGKAVDYWALGVLIYEMLAGVAPFYDDNQFKLYEKIVACDPEYPDYFSEEVIDLLKHLLTPDLSRRYGNLKNGDLDIRGHPWFRSIDFDALASRTFKAPFVPMIKSEGDTSNFDVYDEQTQPYGQPGPDPYRKYFAEF